MDSYFNKLKELFKDENQRALGGDFKMAPQEMVPEAPQEKFQKLNEQMKPMSPEEMEEKKRQMMPYSADNAAAQSISNYFKGKR